MKAGVWILVALTSPPLLLNTTDCPDWKLFSRIRRSMERLSDGVLANLGFNGTCRNGSCHRL